MDLKVLVLWLSVKVDSNLFLLQLPKNFSLKVESRYLTDLPKIRHNGIECGDFNNDGVQDLVCLDGKKKSFRVCYSRPPKPKNGKVRYTLRFLKKSSLPGEERWFV